MAKNYIRTPIGTAYWAKVVTPDTKFVPEGQYSIKLHFPKDEVEELCAFLDTQVEASLEAAKEKNPKLQKVLTTQQPYVEVTDDEGNETGEIEFNFKLKASGTTKDGKKFTQRPVVVDAKGHPVLKFDQYKNVLNNDFSIGNGSKCKVAFEVNPYMTPATKVAGVSLRLRAVQVVELIEFGGGGNFGFEEEEGFEYKDDNFGTSTSTGSPFADSQDTDGDF